MKYTEWDLYKMLYQTRDFSEAALYTGRTKEIERAAVRTFLAMPSAALINYNSERTVLSY